MKTNQELLKEIYEDVYAARIFSGDNLPAQSGLDVVIMLGKGFEED